MYEMNMTKMPFSRMLVPYLATICQMHFDSHHLYQKQFRRKRVKIVKISNLQMRQNGTYVDQHASSTPNFMGLTLKCGR